RHLRAVVAADRLRESSHRALMKAHSDAGDTAAAIQVYRDLRLHLHDELQADVDAETTALYEEIRAGAGQKERVRSRFQVARTPVPLTPLVGRDQELKEIRSRLQVARLVTLTGTGGIGKTRLSIEIAREMQGACSGGICFVELAALTDAAFVAQAV